MKNQTYLKQALLALFRMNSVENIFSIIHNKSKCEEKIFQQVVVFALREMK